MFYLINDKSDVYARAPPCVMFLCLSYNLYYVILKFNIMKLFNDEIVLSIAVTKQLSLFSKINRPFKMIQFVVQKGIKKQEIDSLNSKLEETGSKKVFICREYDGAERYLLVYPQGVTIDSFPQFNSIIFLS